MQKNLAQISFADLIRANEGYPTNWGKDFLYSEVME
jgi:hypothetical protein